MLELAQLGLPELQLLKPGGDRRRRWDEGPERQRVDEDADDRVDVREIGGPAGDRGAEDHVVGVAVPREQQGPGAEQDAVQGELMPASEASQRLGRRLAEPRPPLRGRAERRRGRGGEAAGRAVGAW